jgi:polyphenol oxidase
MSKIHPHWPVPGGVHAVMTTRATREEALAALLPSAPLWLRQVHGAEVVDLDRPSSCREGDAAVTRARNRVCVIRAADCMPVLLAHDEGAVIGAAHAGWRGMSAGVIENTVAAMGVEGKSILAWLGPAIGPKAYEVGDEVRAAFKEKEAFSPTRPGHWLLDLYAVARRRLAQCGVTRVFGGGYCTYSDPARFYSYRRDRTGGRMAAYLWLAA